MHLLVAGPPGEDLAGEMSHRSATRRSKRELAGAGLGRGNEIRERLVGRIGTHHEHDRLRRNDRHRDKVFRRVVGHLCVQRRVDRQVGRLPHAEGVAIRLALGYRVHADVAASARPVFDHKSPSGAGLELVRDETRDEVRATGRRERHDQLDALAGISGLREAAQRRCQAGDECEKERATMQWDH